MQPFPDATRIYPLDEFYRNSGLPLPPIMPIAGSEVPEPYRRLLVNSRDMTPTLEGAYGRNIQLRVLHRSLSDGVLSREVLLIPEGSASPAAFGVIKIHLGHFSAHARKLVLECRQPLGTILRSEDIAHTSRPDHFFQVPADALIQRALHLSESCVLYGRRNVLLGGDSRTIAHVVEILPPANGFK